MEFVMNYYVGVLVLVGIMGSMIIVIDNRVFKMEDVLRCKEDFLKCIFTYQVAVWEYLKDEINIPGIIIIEIITTASVWFLNIIIFAVLIFFLLVKMICYLFWMVFRKRG